MITVKKVASSNEFFHDVADDAGLPITMQTGLNRDDDAITVYPAPCNATVVDLSTNTSTVISPVPTLLLGVFVNTVIGTSAATIADDTTDIVTLPVGLAAGTNLDYHASLFATNLTVNPADDSTGSITVFWMVA